MGDSEKVEKFYKEMIEVCNIRIGNLHNGLRGISEDEDAGNYNLSFDFNTQDLNPQRLNELKRQLNKCSDSDLLSALRDEFIRQLKSHETQRQTLERVAKLNENKVTPPDHHYFRVDYLKDQVKCSRLCHFDGQRIAREMFLSQDESPLLLLAGRDDVQMCQWNIEEARVAEELGDEITESQFNSVWFDNGGFPYVRPGRRIRRFLTSVLTKK